jgi:hypothetical protein
MMHNPAAFLIPPADLTVLIPLLTIRTSKIINPSPDDSKLKIEDYFFLNPLSSYPIFPNTIIVPSTYLIRCLFDAYSMLVRYSIYKVRI